MQRYNKIQNPERFFRIAHAQTMQTHPKIHSKSQAPPILPTSYGYPTVPPHSLIPPHYRKITVE
ncbi:MAG: hypothetical protein MJZ86_03930 [Bacteroidales bacterium]|nr:hypothetical protein [Bacteroidales bacterium]